MQEFLPRPWSAPLAAEDAYRVQYHFVAAQTEGATPAGFRAGTAKKSEREKYGIEEPLFGVLPKKLRVDRSMPIGAFKRPFLEVELALILGDLESCPDARSCVDGIALACVVPDLAFKNLDTLEPTDLIAANLVSEAYILGDPSSVRAIKQRDIAMSLYYKDARAACGEAGTSMDDIWQTADWLMARAISQGYSLRKDQILMVGSIGGAIPLLPGHYSVRSDRLRGFEFHVT